MSDLLDEDILPHSSRHHPPAASLPTSRRQERLRRRYMDYRDSGSEDGSLPQTMIWRESTETLMGTVVPLQHQRDDDDDNKNGDKDNEEDWMEAHRASLRKLKLKQLSKGPRPPARRISGEVMPFSSGGPLPSVKDDEDDRSVLSTPTAQPETNAAKKRVRLMDDLTRGSSGVSLTRAPSSGGSNSEVGMEQAKVTPATTTTTNNGSERLRVVGAKAERNNTEAFHRAQNGDEEAAFHDDDDDGNDEEVEEEVVLYWTNQPDPPQPQPQRHLRATRSSDNEDDDGVYNDNEHKLDKEESGMRIPASADRLLPLTSTNEAPPDGAFFKGASKQRLQEDEENDGHDLEIIVPSELDNRPSRTISELSGTPFPPSLSGGVYSYAARGFIPPEEYDASDNKSKPSSSAKRGRRRGQERNPDQRFIAVVSLAGAAVLLISGVICGVVAYILIGRGDSGSSSVADPPFGPEDLGTTIDISSSGDNQNTNVPTPSAPSPTTTTLTSSDIPIAQHDMFGENDPNSTPASCSLCFESSETAPHPDKSVPSLNGDIACPDYAKHVESQVTDPVTCQVYQMAGSVHCGCQSRPNDCLVCGNGDKKLDELTRKYQDKMPDLVPDENQGGLDGNPVSKPERVPTASPVLGSSPAPVLRTTTNTCSLCQDGSLTDDTTVALQYDSNNRDANDFHVTCTELQKFLNNVQITNEDECLGYQVVGMARCGCPPLSPEPEPEPEPDRCWLCDANGGMAPPVSSMETVVGVSNTTGATWTCMDLLLRSISLTADEDDCQIVRAAAAVCGCPDSNGASP